MDYYSFIKNGSPLPFNEDELENIINGMLEAVQQLEVERWFDGFQNCNRYLNATYNIRYSNCGNEFVENHFQFFHELENRHPKIAVLQFIRSYTDNYFTLEEWIIFLDLLKEVTFSENLEELIEALRKEL